MGLVSLIYALEMVGQRKTNIYIIVAGDFGGVWNGSSEERKKLELDWLDEKPFTTLFVTGNHENYWMLREFPVENWHDGKVQRVRPNILHLMRGSSMTLRGAPSSPWAARPPMM